MAGLSTISLAQAATVAELAGNRNRVRQAAHEAKAKVAATRTRVTQKTQTRATKIEEKRILVQNYKNHLDEQGRERVRTVRATLQDLKILRAQKENVDQIYLARQEKQSQRYSGLIAQYQIYQRTEAAKRDLLQRNLTLVQQSQTVPELAPARSEIHQLYLDEISGHTGIVHPSQSLMQEIREAYSDYEAQIKPLKPSLVRFAIKPLASPEITLRVVLDRLAQIVNYATQRREYFTQVIRQKFPEIERQIDHLIAEEVRSDLNAWDQLKIHGGLISVWNETVNELFSRKSSLLDLKNRVSVGCQQKMRGFYDFYFEVLSYRKKCSNLDELKNQGSPYETGCVLLNPLIQEAEAFFSDSAWKKMNLSLLAAKREALPHLTDLISKLQSFKIYRKEGLEKPELLLKAVKYHDQLLEDWMNWKMAEALEESHP